MPPKKSFCIHGHFYQPPREDPKTGEIPQEPGAFPFHNWNERINAQCYQPNSKLGNFEFISFNVGPTICEWLIGEDPGTMARIVEQDRSNVKNYGVGNAMAQAYNHTILPLAQYDDKVTQVRWGIEDFIHIYGHRPEGMWLPESAIDMETMEVLSQNGIRFTILAPWQAKGNDFDYRYPYRVKLASGNDIVVFFYDSYLSSRVSFDPELTVDADRFLPHSLLPRYDFEPDRPQCITIASDGELYGHHQPFRDKFLQRLIHNAHYSPDIDITFPARWLKENEVKECIEINELTSWSCHHGVKRWAETCGCTPHGEWKAPLRTTMSQLGDWLNTVYKETVSPLVKHPLELRNRYIHVLHQQVSLEELITTFSIKSLTTSEIQTISLLLEAQYERQRMFTSCGWFFDDFDRIEPRNNIAYAAHACWLTYKATGIDLASKAITLLDGVRSWRSGLSAATVFTHRIDQELVTIKSSGAQNSW
ncbi:MAG: DUF3536 domain-containing protein [Anaerolineae bacterium]|nr:DUF3536 domain-containing protein [Anaerolineae bacterium]